MTPAYVQPFPVVWTWSVREGSLSLILRRARIHGYIARARVPADVAASRVWTSVQSRKT